MSITLILTGLAWPTPGLTQNGSAAPQGQLPRKMHIAMNVRPHVTVGLHDTDIVGGDHRALQAAVDYVAGLGGGTVEIGPGTFVMRDSLHLRPHVHVRGHGERTVLLKAPGAISPLEIDGDFGEEQVTLKEPAGFKVGDGIAVWDKNSGGFHTTVARITGQNGKVFSISKPLNADCMVANGATTATVFPVISGYDLEDCVVENLVVDGAKDRNPPLNGCRGAGIFLYRGFGTVLRDCVARNYPGDGIGFQQSNDVIVERCRSEGNAGLGFHPGSGSQRPTVRDSIARANGEDGLFLCWRVQHGQFSGNTFEGNGRFGISIGHKDTDNLFKSNVVRSNDQAGVFFRNETEGMAGHRNRFDSNLIENNGGKAEAPAVAVRGETRDLEFHNNIIRDTRPPGQQRQTVGFQIGERAGTIRLENNQVDSKQPVEDKRPASTPR